MVLLFLLTCLPWCAPEFASAAGASADPGVTSFPPPLESYQDEHLEGLWERLSHRARAEPFNLVATILFLCAIIHTFLAHRFSKLAHRLSEEHAAKLARLEAEGKIGPETPVRRVRGLSRLFHFLGEIEAVFGIWVIPLIITMSILVGRKQTEAYINEQVNFTEAVFVVVIMAISSSRPVLDLAEKGLRLVARLGGEKPAAWWLALLICGPLLGSFITEPAAMTICASLLSRKIYALNPSKRFAYATLGLLFVSISVGGTLTHFAAPPVLMVAGPWKWGTPFMLAHFGWKAALGIVVATLIYLVAFRKELARLGRQPVVAEESAAFPPIPVWVTICHLLFMGFAVLHAHDVPYLFLILLFFIAYTEVTADFHSEFNLRPAVLVGFFLAGLVIHGGLQQWWIGPVLGRLDEVPLMLGAMGLTAFNDNAAITFLATLVPGMTDGMKYAVVAGAVTGGGLTVIANAPNPAGQAILNKHFEDGIGAMGLLVGALVPTAVLLACYLFL